jgi:hypothetical protein
LQPGTQGSSSWARLGDSLHRKCRLTFFVPGSGNAARWTVPSTDERAPCTTAGATSPKFGMRSHDHRWSSRRCLRLVAFRAIEFHQSKLDGSDAGFASDDLNLHHTSALVSNPSKWKDTGKVRGRKKPRKSAALEGLEGLSALNCVRARVCVGAHARAQIILPTLPILPSSSCLMRINVGNTTGYLGAAINLETGTTFRDLSTRLHDASTGNLSAR